MKKNYMERFTGLTLNINPIFTLIGIIYLSVKNIRDLVGKLKEDKVNLYFWAFLALSGIISIFFAVNKGKAIAGFFIPFLFIWLYLLGRWAIKNPQLFIQDMIRGTAILGIIVFIAFVFRLEVSIGEFRILSKFKHLYLRGEVLYVANNSLGLFFQAGILGGLGSILIYWKSKKYFIENVMAIIFSLFGLYVSGSRGALTGVIAGVCFLMIKYWYALLPGAIGTGLILYSQKRFQTLFSLSSHNARLQIWQSSLKLFKDNFWFGVGPGNFGEVYHKYKPATLRIDPTCAHSNYLNIFIGWGLIGGLIFWGWHLFVFRRAFKRGLTPLKRVIMAVLISYFVHVAVNELFAAYSGFLLGLLDNPALDEKPSEGCRIKHS